MGQWLARGRVPQATDLATAVIDILLVALLIYEFLKLIRGTRATPMLLGVFVLAVAFIAARFAELRTLDWLMTTLLPYGIFALIVVFASEIRHALARLGRKFTSSRSSAANAESYDDVVLAATLFSQNQTGALMVIEREIGLRTYIESGVALDAHHFVRLARYHLPAQCPFA